MTEVICSHSRYLKIFTTIVRANVFLLSYVLHDHLVCDIPARGHKISSRPKVATPILFLNMLEFHHQFSRSLTLDILHHFARRKIRRIRQQHMDVIPRHGSLQYFDVMRPADLTHQFTHTKAHCARQHRLAILRYPDEVVLNVVTAVGTRSIVFHALNIMKKP